MLSPKFENEIDKLGSFLISEIENLSVNFTEFGYRERVRIERYLFLLLKAFSQRELDYSLQGFSKCHIEKVNSLAAKKSNDKALNLVVDQVFQLKIYLQALSSENAYVRGDALSKLGLDRKKIFSFIKFQSESIIKKIKRINVEKGVSPDRKKTSKANATRF